MAAQQKRKTILAESTENTIRELEEKAARKELMRIETERRRLVRKHAFFFKFFAYPPFTYVNNVLLLVIYAHTSGEAWKNSKSAFSRMQ